MLKYHTGFVLSHPAQPCSNGVEASVILPPLIPALFQLGGGAGLPYVWHPINPEPVG